MTITHLHARPEQLSTLTSARFFAAMLIVLYHIPGFQSWEQFAWVPKSFVQGVSFFFILSGFVLTHAYINRPRLRFFNFMYGRLAKLWPLHFFMLAATIAYFPPGQPFTEDWFTQNKILLANSTLLHAILPIKAYAFSANQPSWSISTELFFYAAFPFLLLGLRRNWHLKLVGSALLAFAFPMIAHSLGTPYVSDSDTIADLATLLYTSPFVRGFEFCFGMALWVLWDRYVRGRNLHKVVWTVLEATLLLGAAIWLVVGEQYVTASLPWQNLAFWFSAAGGFWLFGGLVVVLATGQGLISKALKWRPLVYLGEISFALYLVHQMVLKNCLVWLDPAVAGPGLFFGTTFFLAIACHEIIERPGQRFLSSLAYRRSGALPRAIPGATKEASEGLAAAA